MSGDVCGHHPWGSSWHRGGGGGTLLSLPVPGMVSTVPRGDCHRRPGPWTVGSSESLPLGTQHRRNTKGAGPRTDGTRSPVQPPCRTDEQTAQRGRALPGVTIR